MGQKAESGHQHYNIDAPQPMVLEHLLNLVEEDARPCLTWPIGFSLLLSSSTEEDFALGKKSSKHGGKSRDTGSGPEQCTPGCVWNEVEVDDGGNEVSNGVSLLNDATSDTTSLDGDILEGGGGG